MDSTTERPPIFLLGDLVRANVQLTDQTNPEAVDVGFVAIEKLPDFSVTKEAFLEAIVAAEKGEFGEISLERLQAGPSYIEIGAWIGDQTLALAFMGLGAILGLWKIITPGTLGIEGDAAKQMMGMGFLMISGLQR